MTKFYKVTAIGNYVAKGKLKEVHDFETVFEMHEGGLSEATAILQNSGLAERQLRRDKKNFYRLRECKAVSSEEIVVEEPTTEKELQKFEDGKEIEGLILKATTLSCIPVDYTSYATDSLRKTKLNEAIERKKKAIIKYNNRVIGKKQGVLEG